jgi:hypothetical protein
MKTFEKLESLGFFDWLSKTHNLRDTDMKPEYLDELPLNDIHRTVANSMVFRWFREKYFYLSYVCSPYKEYNEFYFRIRHIGDVINEGELENFESQVYKSYEEAELSCLNKLIEIVEPKSE